ncbi:MAG: class I SAM-dependent methyltransferase, partial [Arcobacter sp.]|nr:class I SAM-dependent methyltransferase [Arcobacter sp.]
GSGLVSFCFAKDVREIKGLDYSSGMIEVYNEKAKKIGLGNISGKIHDINHEELEKDIFDLVVTNMTMHHINKPFDFINKLAKSLKSHGKLFIPDLCLEDGTFHSDNADVVHFGFEAKTIEEAFFQAGLENIKIEKLHSIHKLSKTYDIFLATGSKK